MKSVAFLIAMTTLCLSGCGSGNADIQSAKLAIQRQDYTTALDHYRKLSDFGIPEAKVELAMMLDKGQGISRPDPVQARALLEQAAAENHPRGLLELGKFYQDGKGGRKDIAIAKDLYQQSLKYGYIRANHQLGTISEDEKDYVSAETLYRRAFAGGYYRAALNLARLSETGKIQKADPVMALAWYYAARQRSVTGTDEPIARLESMLGAEKSATALLISERLT